MIPFSFIGFLLIPGTGEMIGFVLSLFIFIGIIFWGDKIILTLASAFLLKGKTSLRQTISNQACLLGLNPVELYISHKHPDNIYYVGSLLENSIIIGRALFDSLEKKEIKSLVTFGIYKIKTSGTSYVSISTLCFAIFLMPLFILKYLTKIKRFHLDRIFSVLSDLTMFFYMPALAFNQAVMNKIHDHESFDKEFCHKTHLGHSLSSALFKIETKKRAPTLTGSSFILNQLAITPDVNLEIIRDINFIKNPFAKRYKNIFEKGSLK